MQEAIELTAEPASVPVARRFVRRVLDSWRLPELEDAVTLVVSELVTNALLHASTPMRLEIHRNGERLRVGVRDASPLLPAPRRSFSAESGTGRGMLLIECTASAWGADPVVDPADPPPGKVVWAELTLS